MVFTRHEVHPLEVPAHLLWSLAFNIEESAIRRNTNFVRSFLIIDRVRDVRSNAEHHSSGAERGTGKRASRHQRRSCR
jgi:hypothetical protein